jgi:hypothetical protein
MKSARMRAGGGGGGGGRRRGGELTGRGKRWRGRKIVKLTESLTEIEYNLKQAIQTILGVYQVSTSTPSFVQLDRPSNIYRE